MLIARSPVRISLAGGGTDLPAYYLRYGGAVINTAINRRGLPAHYTQVIQGLLVLAAVLLDTLKLQIRQRFA